MTGEQGILDGKETEKGNTPKQIRPNQLVYPSILLFCAKKTNCPTQRPL